MGVTYLRIFSVLGDASKLRLMSHQRGADVSEGSPQALIEIRSNQRESW